MDECNLEKRADGRLWQCITDRDRRLGFALTKGARLCGPRYAATTLCLKCLRSLIHLHKKMESMRTESTFSDAPIIIPQKGYNPTTSKFQARWSRRPLSLRRRDNYCICSEVRGSETQKRLDATQFFLVEYYYSYISYSPDNHLHGPQSGD